MFTQKKEKTSFSTSGAIVEGIPSLSKGTQCGICTDEDALTIQQMNVKNAPSYQIKISQIKNIDIISEQEVIEKNRNVIGRGVIGGLLLGSVGALVGGMSGISPKTKKETTYYLVINYQPSNTEDISVITFQVSMIFTTSLVSYIQRKISETATGIVML